MNTKHPSRRLRKAAVAALLVGLTGGTIAELAPTPASAATAAKDRLAINAQLSGGQRLTSPSGSVSLLMQTDGNLVIYAPGNRPLWSTNTAGNAGAVARMQADGNLVIYATSNRPIWSSNTAGAGATSLAMQNDGNLVLYTASNVAVWSTGTWAGSDRLPSGAQLVPSQTDPRVSEIRSPDGQQRLVMQTDGNLVLLRSGTPVWAAGTAGKGGAVLRMQADGNLVLYTSTNRPVWSTGTAAVTGASLVLQNDGNLVLYSAANVPVWWTNTVVNRTTRASLAVKAALSQLGVPYVYGGKSPSGFDCSGLVQWAYAQANMSLPAPSGTQYGLSTPIDPSQARPGDLLFYGFKGQNHVAMYIGNGQMVEAPYTGATVRVTAVRTGSTFAGWRHVPGAESPA